MTAESAMHCTSECERTLAQPSKQATALLGSPASVLRENCARTVNSEQRTEMLENEMLLLKLAKFYVRS